MFVYIYMYIYIYIARSERVAHGDSSARRGEFNLFVSVIKISTPSSPPPLAPL